MSYPPAVTGELLPAKMQGSQSWDDYRIKGIPFWTFLTTVCAVLITTIGMICLYATVQIYKVPPPKRKERDPNLPKVTEVVSLRIYPIKSCRGIEINSCRLSKAGLDLDRHWMFVDAKTKEFLTIRSNPSMTLIRTGISGPDNPQLTGQWSELNIGIDGTKTHIKVPCFPSEDWLKANCKLIEVSIWGGKTDSWQYSDEINSVFTDFFKKDVLLVYKGPTPRMASGNGAKELYGKEEPHHFADVMSLQVASEASLADLNKRLKEAGHDEITIERFRPNIIIKGNEPWEEDRWKKVQINAMEHAREMFWRTPLDVLARCARCQVPNVNPDTADKHPKEPWDTLMKFRRVDQGGVAKYKPCFGMLCIPTGVGHVRVGAEFEVLEMTEKHSYNTAKFDEL